MKLNTYPQILMVILTMILITFINGCGVRVDTEKDSSTKKVSPKVIINYYYNGCSCDEKNRVDNNSAIIFTNDEHTEFNIDSTKIIGSGNHYFIPLNLKSSQKENDVFVNVFPEYLVKILSKLEKQKGRKIISWKYDDLYSETDYIHRFILFSMWVDFEEENTSVSVHRDQSYIVVVESGGSLWKTLHMDDKTALAFAIENNLKYWYVGKVLHVLVHKGDKFLLSCELIK